MKRRVQTVYSMRRADIGVGARFDPHEIAVGVVWRFRRFNGTIHGWDRKHGDYTGRPWTLDLYVCLFPMFPAHVWISRVTRDAL